MTPHTRPNAAHTMFVAIDGFARALQPTCELGHGCGVSFDLYSGRRTQVISGANQNASRSAQFEHNFADRNSASPHNFHFRLLTYPWQSIVSMSIIVILHILIITTLLTA